MILSIPQLKNLIWWFSDTLVNRVPNTGGRIVLYAVYEQGHEHKSDSEATWMPTDGGTDK